MGICRTNLFKRLESSGQALIQSIERHILRNFVYLHAILLLTGLALNEAGDVEREPMQI